jgi:hypothetical protein
MTRRFTYIVGRIVALAIAAPVILWRVATWWRA